MTQAWLQSAWMTRGPVAVVLWPLSRVYALLAWLDKALYTTGARTIRSSSLPVVVVGNLSVGGTGKSPLVAWLCEVFAAEGLRPGIVSRGYGGQITEGSHRVAVDDSAARVGDEPLMLARQTLKPVCIARQRAEAVASLEQSGEVDVVLSDDGLQHHAMAREVEIVVIDDARGFGNRWRLPAGPLREPVQRINTVDWVVHQRRPGDNEQEGVASFVLEAEHCTALATGELAPLAQFAGQRVHAVAAIGRPARFFETLRLAGVDVIEHALPDHHPLQRSDVCFEDGLAVLITAKDAVKLDAHDTNDIPIYIVTTRLMPSAALTRAAQQLAARLAASANSE